jgi:hypothetical protein
MVRCGKRLMRTNRNGEVIDSPGMSYTCELNIDDGPHNGPCSNPSDQHSVAMRVKWEREDAEMVAEKRHQASGLSMVQGRPQPVSSIIEGGSLMPHSSSIIKCPFCDERGIMVKELSGHIQGHAAEIEAQPEPSVMWQDHFKVIDDYFVSLRPFLKIPDKVIEACDALYKMSGNE